MNVLMVDDEEDIRKIGKMSLEAVGGHRVTLAASAIEAMACARTERPDVILMDMMMPGMDGLSALATMRSAEDLLDVPIVFMTARIQRHEIDEYLRAGAIGVIRKPFDPMALPRELESLLVAGKTPQGG